MARPGRAVAAPTSWRGRAPASAARRRSSVPAFWLAAFGQAAETCRTSRRSMRWRTFAASLRTLKPPSSRFSRDREERERRGGLRATSAMPSLAALVRRRRRDVLSAKYDRARAAAAARPAIARSVVDFPAPFGADQARRSRRDRAASEMSRQTATSPVGKLESFDRQTARSQQFSAEIGRDHRRILLHLRPARPRTDAGRSP